MKLLRRILFICLMSITFPLLGIMAFITILILTPVGVIYWVLTGNDFDWTFEPFMWVAGLPFIISRIEK